MSSFSTEGPTLKTLARALALTIVASLAAFAAPPADAATPAGTNISNAATATYQDGSGTNFTTNSNTVTVVVQNVAAETVTNLTTGQNVAPYQTVTDKWTLTNAGNSSGKFQLTALPATTTTGSIAPADTTIVLTPQGGGSFSYTLTGNAATDLAALNTQLNTYGIPAGNTVEVDEKYTTGNAVATANQTDTTTLSATLTYAGGSGYAAQTTPASTATQNDTLQPDAVLDVLKADTPPTTAAATIKYDIGVANHGAYATQPVALSSIGSGLPASGVIAAIDAIPAPAGVPLALKTVPTVATNAANGYAGTGANLYFTTATPSFSGSTTWTQITGATTVASLAGATYLALVVTGPSSIAGKGTGFSSTPTGTGTTPSVPNPAVSMHFETAQPAKGTSVTNMANAIAGSNATDTSGNPVPLLIGPNSTGSYDDTAVSAADLNGMLQNTRASSDATPGSGSGFSNRVTDAAVSAALNLGPLNLPAATGAFSLAAGAAAYYDSGTADNSHDYTALALFGGQTSGGTYTTAAAPSVISVPNTLINNGNTSDTFTITASALTNTTGWTVQYSTSANCSGASSSYTTASVAVGASLTFYACYTPPASTALSVYTPYGYQVTATSVSDNTVSNSSYDLLYAGGFVALSKTAATSGTPLQGAQPCASAPTAGCTVTYTITYQNLLPKTGSNDLFGGATLASSGTGTLTSAGISGFQVLEDGVNGANANAASGNKNNWGCFGTSAACAAALSAGLTAAPTDPSAKCSFFYLSDNGVTTLTTGNGSATAPSAGSPASAWRCSYGGNPLTAGTTQTLTFATTIK